MIITEKKILRYKIKEIHFSDYPEDINGCDFLSFQYCKNKVNPKGFSCRQELTSVINLNQDLEKIWQSMDNKSARYRIKRAERDGIKVFINEDYDEFFKLYRSFMKKRRLKSIFDIFGVGKISLETLKKYGTLFTAKHEGDILAGTIYLEDDSNIKSWIGVSNRYNIEPKKAMMTSGADRLIDWEAIKYAKEKGIKNFDLGGLWPEQEAKKDEQKKGINNYKLGMGGEVNTCYTYQKIYSKSYRLAYYLYNLKKLEEDKN